MLFIILLLCFLTKTKDNDDDNDSGMLQGIIEIDECYIGGKSSNKHMKQRIALKEKDNKAVVIGMIKRNGEVKAYHIENAKTYNLQDKIYSNVKEGSTIITDEFAGYNVLKWNYKHKTINHSKGEYVKQDKELKLYTNSIEGFWGTLKRGVVGVYHHISKKYLQNYVNEFCFRYNNRNNASVFDLVLVGSVG